MLLPGAQSGHDGGVGGQLGWAGMAGGNDGLVRECARPVRSTRAASLAAVSVQPWSTVWRVSTDRGDFCLKQTMPARAFEGPVQAACAVLAPEQVDAPVAVDTATPRWLVPDRGTTMLDTDIATRGIDTGPVTVMLTDFARFQRATEPGPDLLLGAGLPVWNPALAAVDAQDQAEFLHRLNSDDPRRIDAAQVGEVIAALDDIDAAARLLSGSPVPWCVEHGDLWPGNVFPPAETDRCGSYRFFDLGDACWSHPFLSLIMMVTECRFRWQTPDLVDGLNLADERLWQVFDAYLQAWSDLADLDQLEALLCAAVRIAPLRRSRAWIINTEHANPAVPPDPGNATPWTWLQDTTRPVFGRVG